MTVVSGMENSIFFVFSIMGCLFFFILYNIIKFFSERQTIIIQQSINDHNNSHQVQGSQEPAEGECCICLQQFTDRVSTLCNHTFCGKLWIKKDHV